MGQAAAAHNAIGDPAELTLFDFSPVALVHCAQNRAGKPNLFSFGAWQAGLRDGGLGRTLMPHDRILALAIIPKSWRYAAIVAV
jgi:hypothetical protein